MEVLKGGPYINSVERVYIYTDATSDNQSNDKHAIFPDIIFDIILKN
jgi:hypothetical protein